MHEIDCSGVLIVSGYVDPMEAREKVNKYAYVNTTTNPNILRTVSEEQVDDGSQKLFSLFFSRIYKITFPLLRNR